MPVYPQSFAGFVKTTNGNLKDLFTAVNSKVLTAIAEAGAIFLRGQNSEIAIYPDGNFSGTDHVAPGFFLKPAGTTDRASIHLNKMFDENQLTLKSSESTNSPEVRINPDAYYETSSVNASFTMDTAGFEMKSPGYIMRMGPNYFRINRGPAAGSTFEVEGDTIKFRFRNSSSNETGGAPSVGGLLQITPDEIQISHRPASTSFGGGYMYIRHNTVRASVLPKDNVGTALSNMNFSTTIASFSHKSGAVGN